MTLPNFLIIGAAKAGTTSLAYYLAQHPQIYMSPVKEPRFFAPEFYTTGQTKFLKADGRKTPYTLEEYGQLFQGVQSEIAVGEASTEYLYFPESPHRIKKIIPEVKLIAILRNPAERAFSAYCYQMQDAREDCAFEQALKQEKQRLQEGWRPGWLYQNSGYYYQQLKRYYDVFDSSQIRVYLLEELEQNPHSVLKDIFSFLNVCTDFQPDLSHKNTSSFPRNAYLNTLITNNPYKLVVKTLIPRRLYKNVASRIRSYNTTSKPKLDDYIRKQLIDAYRDDINQLEKLLQKDLSQWLI